MENRLREFSPSGIMKLFKRYYDEKRLDTYWFESVFLTLFREGQYQYDARDLGAIFRYMMIYNIEVIYVLCSMTRDSTIASTKKL